MKLQMLKFKKKSIIKINQMAKIAGVTNIRNAKGELTHIRIDVKKHKDKMVMLKEMGLVPKTKILQSWDLEIANEKKTI